MKGGFRLEAALCFFRTRDGAEPAIGAVERGELTFAWEPRGDWTKDEIGPLCEDPDLMHCVDPFDADTVTEEAATLCLQGIDGYYRNQTDEELQELRGLCRSLEETCVLFNKTSTWDDALRFREILGQV